MSLVKKNIVANLIGSGWVGLVSLASIPLYIHFLGLEAYGLVGFYLSLQALFIVLDIGLTATVSRELARLSILPNTDREVRNLVRTLEIVYWCIAIVIAAITTQLAPWIATKWLSTSELSIEDVELAVVLIGLMIALRMPFGFYSGGLLGLQHQVLLNFIRILVETLKHGGGVLVLWLVSSSIISLFIWHLVIAVLGTALVIAMLWRKLPRGKFARFDIGLLRGIWRFAVGISGVSILGAILTQADKIVLSTMLPLGVFAYYVLASTAAMSLNLIITPVFSAIYPRLTELVANNDEALVQSLYHKSCQFMTVLVMPIAMVIGFFSEDLLRLWTQDNSVAIEAAPILSLLIIGTAFNGMMNIPYALQLAHGWTRLVLYMNTIAIVVLLPILIIIVPVYGVMGGAVVWLSLNTGYIIFGLYFMHRRLLCGELRNWFVNDFCLPGIAALVIVMAFWAARWEGLNGIYLVLWMLLAYSLSFAAAVSMASALRPVARSWAAKFISANI